MLYFFNQSERIKIEAEQGDANAQFSLGLQYYQGKGVKKDYYEAVKWFRKAAEQGNVKAQFDLGAAYYMGNGIDQNIHEAEKWIRKAAEQRDTDGQYFLGRMYQEGSGLPKDIVLAYMWFSLAAEENNQTAQTKKSEIEKTMTPTQIAEAHHKIEEWVSKHKGREGSAPQ